MRFNHDLYQIFIWICPSLIQVSNRLALLESVDSVGTTSKENFKSTVVKASENFVTVVLRNGVRNTDDFRV